MTEEERDDVLALLHEDLDVNKKLLQTIKEQIKANDVSNYPIFVAADEPIDLGRIIINKQEHNSHWYFFVSHLEEFAIKGVVAEDKIDHFREVYKEHHDELCIFVVANEAGDFVFLPA